MGDKTALTSKVLRTQLADLSRSAVWAIGQYGFVATGQNYQQLRLLPASARLSALPRNDSKNSLAAAAASTLPPYFLTPTALLLNEPCKNS